ncbi:lactonase family protein [Bauldia litoralis]|uniref:6-phosphogluconolactonase n=1 Tax=Bauldia litoralis TaxID=665467 RepID=A0A1G6BS43_9HYPH|nr:lactonase family protein [Bauldia litoralis]SDB23444.1 6-phosphogluconolactonase [Bauldia litoralis]
MTTQSLVFIGSLNRETPYFQGARGPGLSVYALDETTLDATLLTETSAVDNPTFITATADGTHLYATSEVFEWREGLVSAFAYDRATSTLSYINKQPTLGSIAAHNAISSDGTKVLAANYAMGEGGPDQSVAVYDIRDDGGLTPPRGSIAHTGTGPNAERQERSHAHSVNPVPGSDLVIVADLGIDKLVSYCLGADGALTRVSEFATAPGAGPRHVAFHPDGRFMFVMNELDSTFATLSIDAASGALTLVDTLPAVAAEARDGNHCADIQISPDGRFLYGSNRGHDSVAIVAVDQASGKLTLVDYVPCGGATPRNLALNPSGSLLFSANQNGDNVTIFRRDTETGRLTDAGRPIRIGTPMCVRVVD